MIGRRSRLQETLRMDPLDREILDAVMAQKDEVAALFDALRRQSPDPSGPGVCRDTYGPGEQTGYRIIAAYASTMGLEQRSDHAANLYMTFPGRDRSAPRVMMGSHIDSVANGGNFDGAAGVIAGLVATKALQKVGLTPACDVTTMAIRAEESVWFQVSYIGSRSAFGVLPDGALEARRTDTGRTLAEHMADCGADVEAVRAGKAALHAKDIKAWVEVHIEQAPQLIEAGLPVAVGTGVPGNFRYPYIRVRGTYDHVGLPRRFRHDAVLAASELALGLDEIWRENEAAGKPMAFTIGRFHTDPKEHALTKVAGEMTLSLDVRTYDTAHLAALEDRLKALVRDIESRRGVTIDLGARASADVAPSTPRVREALTAAAKAVEIAAMPLASPASHDTATFTVAGVPSCMLFVRNANGSHNPHEAMEVDDFMKTAAVLAKWLVEESGAVRANATAS
jgi:beta-ureidopropionase / N-carbamoyl-L-amino-acid hydrolase